MGEVGGVGKISVEVEVKVEKSGLSRNLCKRKTC